MAWRLESDRPIYLQIVEQIRVQILSGKYKVGDRLPSVRDWAIEAAVNPNTMQRALMELERDGLIITQRTTGRMVTQDQILINSLRMQIGKSKLDYFIQGMKRLGFNHDDLMALLREELEENKDERIGNKES